MQHHPYSSFCLCSGLHSSSLDTSSLLTGSTPQPQFCRTVAAGAADSSTVESGKVCHLSSSTDEVWKDHVSCVLLCQYLFAIEKKTIKLSITTPEKLHYCFPTSTVLQALGILGNTILMTSVLLLFPLCTSTREGGHYTTATSVVHSCIDRSWTYLLDGSVLNSVGIVIIVNDIQIHHCLSWH